MLASPVAQRSRICLQCRSRRKTVGLIPGWGRSLEEGMATHSSILAWRLPWTEEPGGPQSLGSPRVRYDWATKHWASSITSLRHTQVSVPQLYSLATARISLLPPLENVWMWFDFIYFFLASLIAWPSLVAQMVKNVPAMKETQVRSLGWEDTLEEGMATHSSILA